MKKLTLSANAAVVREDKKIAAANGTTVTAMFERFVWLLVRRREGARPLGPLTRKAAGLISLPKGRSARRVLTDALAEKYGLNRKKV